MMVLLFPVSVLVLAAFWLRHAGWREAGRSPLTAALTGLALSYGLALLLLSADPYVDDNGSREFVEWRFRWFWAAEIAGWMAVFVIPAVLGLQTAAIWLRSRIAQRDRAGGVAGLTKHPPAHQTSAADS